MKPGYWLLFLMVALIAGYAGWTLYAQRQTAPSAPEISGVVYPEPRVATPVALVRHDGRPFEMSHLHQ